MEEGSLLSSSAAAATSKKRKRKKLHESSSPKPSSCSPLRFPYLHRVVCGYNADGGEICEPISGEAIATYMKQKNKYEKKIAREQKVPTLTTLYPRSCLVDPSMYGIRQSLSRPCISASNSLVGVECFDGGKTKNIYSGLIIGYNPITKVSTILSCATLTHKQSSTIEWSGNDEHMLNPKIFVRFPDGKRVAGKIAYEQQHFGLSFIEVETDQPKVLAQFTLESSFEKGALVLGRDKKSFMRMYHGHMNPSNGPVYHRNHYMYVDTHVDECITGGAVVNANSCTADFVGMVIHTAPTGFLPASVLLKCFEHIHHFGHIRRPQIGMKVWAVRQYDFPTLEILSHICSIDTGVVVVEIAEGSPAEKLGIRMGDIIYTLNGQSVGDTIELEKLLLCLAFEEEKECLALGESACKHVTVKLEVFHVRKTTQSTVSLTVPLSDEVEIFPCLAKQATCSELDATEHLQAEPTLQADAVAELPPESRGPRERRTPGGWGKGFAAKFGCPGQMTLRPRK